MRVPVILVLLSGGFGTVWCRMGGERPVEPSPVAHGILVGDLAGNGTGDRAPETRGGNASRVAVRFVLDGDRVSLKGISRLHGGFRERRVPRAAYPGMLRCALVDADGKVLAEELLIEPDRTCGVVLGTGALKSGFRRGPVMCQTRLPDEPAAVALVVSRVTGSGENPLGKLAITR